MVRRALLRILLPIVGRVFAFLFWRRAHRAQSRIVVRAMRTWFDSLAPIYEPTARRLAGGIYEDALCAAVEAIRRTRAGGMAGLPGCDREWILDVCTGWGVVARRLAGAFPGASVVCADLSLAMLRETRRRWRGNGRPEPYCIQADAAHLPFRDDLYEVVMLQNAPPYVEEMVRVGAPGGAVALTYTFGAVVPRGYDGMITMRCEEAGLERVRVERTGGGAFVLGTKQGKRSVR